MFFGKPAPEKIGLKELSGLLDSLFVKKVGNMDSKASAIVSELNTEKVEFINAADELERLDAKPYMEDVWMANESGVKSKKKAYALALRQLMAGMSLDDKSGNVYNRYKSVLSSIDSTTKEILETNANFKLVFYCYSGYMKNFKTIFAKIERLRESLRNEVESRSKDASDYESLSGKIADLVLQGEEIEALNHSIKALREKREGESRDEAQRNLDRLRKDLEVRKGELAASSADISKLSDRISLLTIPLDRASKKFDHVSARKKQLNAFVEDPIGSINNDEEYKEFRSMLTELKDSIEKGAVDVKNRSESMSVIATLLVTDIKSMIDSLKAARQRRSGIQSEIMTLESAILDLQKKGADSEKVSKDIGDMEGKLKDIERSRVATRIAIETLFLSYYRKPIAVVI